MKFRIYLREAHRKSGRTPYAVAKATGLSPTTVSKYADNEYVESEYIPPAVVTLSKFYGVNWRSNEVIKEVE
jgi:hypothetical protein